MSNKKHGGSRLGAGRKGAKTIITTPAIRTEAEASLVGDPGFALRVFGRIGENEAPKKITSPEDYQLALLYHSDINVRSFNFNRLLDRIYGKPAAVVLQADTREQSVPLTRGNLRSSFGSDTPRVN